LPLRTPVDDFVGGLDYEAVLADDMRTVFGRVELNLVCQLNCVSVTVLSCHFVASLDDRLDGVSEAWTLDCDLTVNEASVQHVPESDFDCLTGCHPLLARNCEAC